MISIVPERAPDDVSHKSAIACPGGRIT